MPNLMRRCAATSVPSKPGARTGSMQEPAQPSRPELGAARPDDAGDRGEGAGRSAVELLDPLDPETRRWAQLAPPLACPLSPPLPHSPGAESDVAPRARVSMEELLPQLVRRIAWAGDRRRGSVQLELGAGPHAGTTITVHADDGRVRVQLEGSGADALRERIRTRLERHGLAVDEVR